MSAGAREQQAADAIERAGAPPPHPVCPSSPQGAIPHQTVTPSHKKFPISDLRPFVHSNNSPLHECQINAGIELTGEHHGQAEQESAARTGRTICGSEGIGGTFWGARSGSGCCGGWQEEVRGREDGEDGSCGTQERLSV